MGLAGQHGPLAAASVGWFLTPSPLPGPLLFAEPFRRRMRVPLGELWFADGPVTRHPDLGAVTWLRVETAQHDVGNAAWRYDSLPSHAAVLAGRVAFCWQAMTVFYEEDERIVGHATDGQTFCPYKGMASYYSVGERARAAWPYLNAWPGADRAHNLVSFDPDKIDVFLDGELLHAGPAPTAVDGSIERGLRSDEILYAARLSE
jgi:uncharacterized protein (DUF427 family)